VSSFRRDQSSPPPPPVPTRFPVHTICLYKWNFYRPGNPIIVRIFPRPSFSTSPSTMGIVSFITGVVAPIFIIISPITSYADQTYAIHRAKSSAGFSLDIPLIMLVASILRQGNLSGQCTTNYADKNLCRVFYYPGAKFDTSLLIQSFIMIVIQLVLLKVALDHRPGPSSKGGDAAIPFAGSREGELGVSRPYSFWQWRSPKPYASLIHTIGKQKH